MNEKERIDSLEELVYEFNEVDTRYRKWRWKVMNLLEELKNE